MLKRSLHYHFDLARDGWSSSSKIRSKILCLKMTNAKFTNVENQIAYSYHGFSYEVFNYSLSFHHKQFSINFGTSHKETDGIN